MNLEKMDNLVNNLTTQGKGNADRANKLILIQNVKLQSGMAGPACNHESVWLSHLRFMNGLHDTGAEYIDTLTKLRSVCERHSTEQSPAEVAQMKSVVIRMLNDVINYTQKSQDKIKQEIVRAETALGELIPKLEIPGLG